MIKHLESNNFDEIIKEGKILVDFYADWCGPCTMMGEVLEQINSVDILKVNTDMYPELAQRFGVMSIPTLILFENGEIKTQTVGFKTLDEINEIVQ